MIDKMTPEEFVKVQRREALYAVKGMLEGTVAIFEGCRFLFYVWNLAEFPEDDHYHFLNYVDRHFEEFPNQNELPDYSQEDISKINHDKQLIVEYYKPGIFQMCHCILESYAKEDGSVLNNQERKGINEKEALDVHEESGSIVTRSLRTISKKERNQNDLGGLTIRALERNPLSITMIGMPT